MLKQVFQRMNGKRYISCFTTRGTVGLQSYGNFAKKTLTENNCLEICEIYLCHLTLHVLAEGS